MYGRDYAGKTLNFEASGGLTNASLIMQDQETDSYWSIMKGKACTGALKGEKLKELPIGEKMTWQSWREKHPDTKVLSFRNREDGRDSYGRYFDNPEGFRGLEAKDDRLATKSAIFAFHHGERSFAAKSEDLVNGASFVLPSVEQNGSVAKAGTLFLFREKGDDIRRSTTAFFSEAGFTNREGDWVENETGLSFDRQQREFPGADMDRIRGFDTYWYNWSLNNPSTEIIQPSVLRATTE